jgi:hypothetical protein
LLWISTVPWSWQHDEVDIRSACFALMEIADVRWWPPRKAPPGDGAPSEGWLLVEDHQIVGAAEFIQATIMAAFGPSQPTWVLGLGVG